MSELKKISVLVKTVFGSDDGQKLLKEMNELFCECPLFDHSEKYVYYRIGKRDLIKELNFYFKASEKDLQEIDADLDIDKDFFK